MRGVSAGEGGLVAARETPIMRAVRAVLAAQPDVTIWRNNTGGGIIGYDDSDPSSDEGRWVNFGLGKGGADLVGILGPHGRFIAFETKAPKRGPSKFQRMWGSAVRARGGFYAIVRSADAALSALQRARAGASE